MRNKFITIVLFLIALCLITSCSNKQNRIEIYSFSGQNETLAINNGIIIVTNEMEKLIGGDLTFINEELSGVKEYNTRLYYYKDGDEVTISSNSASIEGSDDGMHIQSNLGSSSSKDLFYDNDLELMIKSLNFTITGTYITGENFEYKAVLDVKKVY